MDKENKILQSEKAFKKSFEKYEVDFDPKAFEGFKKSLSDSKPKNAWYKHVNFLVLSMFIIGLACGYWILRTPDHLDNKSMTSNQGLRQSQTQIQNPEQKVTQKETQPSTSLVNNKKLVQQKNTRPNTWPNTNEVQQNRKWSVSELKSLNKESNEKLVRNNFLENITTDESQDNFLLGDDANAAKSIGLNVGSKELALQEQNELEGLLNKKDEEELNQVDGFKLKLDEAPLIVDDALEQRDVLEKVPGVQGLKISALDFSTQRALSPIDLVLPVEKYASHFYVGLDISAKHDINYGFFDPYVSVSTLAESIYLEGFFKVTAGYQWLKNTAFELSYSKYTNLLKWSVENNYTGSYGVGASLITLRMVNRVFLLKNRISFTGSVGYALGISDSNQIDASVNSVGSDITVGVENQSFQYTSQFSGFNSTRFYQNWHLGASLNFKMKRRMELVFAGNWNIGHKEIMRADINYLVGEGIPGNYELYSNGSFWTFDIGLRYRFKKK